MKTIKFLIALLLPVIFLSCEKEEEQTEREWTVIGYFSGNNNLDYSQGGSSYIIGDVQEMEHAGCSEQVNSVVMLSSYKTGGNSNYYEIEHAQDQLPDQVCSPLLEDMGTKDMSDPQTLIDFIDYAVENYPAKRYMLIIDSHGGGWEGLSPDEMNGSGDLMSLADLRKAIGTGPYMDVVVFHACLMSMVEVAYEIKDLAHYMVSSEISMPALSVLGANSWLKDLISDPEMSSFDISKKIVQCVYENGKFAQKTAHMAVTDLTQMDNLSSDIANLGTKLTTEVRENWNEVLESWAETHYVSQGYPAYTDLREFVKKLQQKEGLSQINYIVQAGDSVLSAFNKAVPFTKCYLENTDQPYGGLTIHFPQQEADFKEEQYKTLKFKDTNWYKFLRIFIDNTQQFNEQENPENPGNQEDPEGENRIGLEGTVSYPGHIISETCYFLVYEVDSDGNTTLLGYDDVSTNGVIDSWISNVDETLYLAFEVIDDVNNNDELEAGEGYAFWDPDNDGEYDILEAKPGTDYTGIDFTLVPNVAKKSLKLNDIPKSIYKINKIGR